jgi:hypothetical protein
MGAGWWRPARTRTDTMTATPPHDAPRMHPHPRTMYSVGECKRELGTKNSSTTALLQTSAKKAGTPFSGKATLKSHEKSTWISSRRAAPRANEQVKSECASLLISQPRSSWRKHAPATHDACTASVAQSPYTECCFAAGYLKHVEPPSRDVVRSNTHVVLGFAINSTSGSWRPAMRGWDHASAQGK